jgi:hypothetical protein
MSTRPIAFVAAMSVGLLAGLLFWLPAAWFARALPEGIRCDDPNGAIWRGRCGRFELAGAAAGALRWRLHGSELLRGRAVLELDWSPGRGHAHGTLQAPIFGATVISLLDVTLDSDVAELRRIAPRLTWPVGVDAAVHLTIDRLKFSDNGPSELVGRGRIEDVRGLAQQTGAASFMLEARAPGTPPVVTVSTVAGSTIDVSGTLNFTTPRSYVVDLTLKTQNLPTPMPYSIAGSY